MATLKKSINEDRLFSLLPYFFENPYSVLVEIAQNAARSGATRLDITIQGNRLTTVDDGKGIDNPASLFVLADSDWDEDVEKNQNPAGWGLFFLYSIAERVMFRSGFGSVEIDCERYLKERDYRLNVLNNVGPGPLKGFRIEADLKPELRDRITAGTNELGWFPLDITFNGTPVDKASIDDLGSYAIKTTYQGNRVLIEPKNFFVDSPGALVRNLHVVWYGISIPCDRYRLTKPAVVIEVTNGSPLTPVLPYRKSVKQDEKIEAFWRFLKGVVVKYCTAYINAPENKDERKLRSYMKTMECIAGQKELDKLKRFYVVLSEPFNQGTYVSKFYEHAIISTEDPPMTNQTLILEGLEGYISDYDDHFLPEGAVKSVELPDKHPGWLYGKVKEKEIVVRVKPDASIEFQGRFKWLRAEIESDAGIKVLTVVSDTDSGFIFYEDDPCEFYEVYDVVFDNRVFYEDGDTWDSQWDSFDDEIREDIMKLTGTYRIYDLLGGLRIAGVDPWDVQALGVNTTEKVLTIRTRTDVKTLRLS